MLKNFVFVIFTVFLFSACATVPMEDSLKSDLAKKFDPPSGGKAGLYIYRSGSFGAAIKKDIWVDGKCIGESAPNIFFYEEVQGNEDHKISTESEFSPNDVLFKAEGGKNYFIHQYIKMGVFVGGAGLELVNEETGKKEVSELTLAKKGSCSK
jgi:hypothetical protein